MIKGLNREHAELWITVLEDVKEKLGEFYEFNMADWHYTFYSEPGGGRCGTAACAAGYLGLDPRARALGFTTVDGQIYYTIPEKPYAGHGAVIAWLFPEMYLNYDYDDYAELIVMADAYFNWDEENRRIQPGDIDRITPQHVIDRLRYMLDADETLSAEEHKANLRKIGLMEVGVKDA